MKAAWFILLVLLVTSGILAWRLSDPEFRSQARAFLRLHWWVLPLVFIVLAALLFAVSSFSIKVF